VTAKLIPLTDWADRIYGDQAPNVDTLRRWAREARISPAPVKHGRSYFVAPDATYVPPYAPQRPQRRRLVERLRVATAAQRA
jgi:hypothetical protein